jgi:hypothetical protein
VLNRIDRSFSPQTKILYDAGSATLVDLGGVGRALKTLGLPSLYRDTQPTPSKRHTKLAINSPYNRSLLVYFYPPILVIYSSTSSVAFPYSVD